MNIGFGMGLVDNAIQRQLAEYKRKNPDDNVAHTIVEAHPQVYARMLAEGWGAKEGVTIVYGRWQDKMTELESFDGELASLVVSSFCRHLQGPMNLPQCRDKCHDLI